MIDVAVLPLYLTAVMALLLLPGPDMLLIASSSLSYGRKVGVCASLGNATSGMILTVVAALGVSALIAANPFALPILQLLGAAYLLKMGIDCMRAGRHPPAICDEGQAMAYYQRALFSNLLNPKALMFFVMFLPQFVSGNSEATSAEQMLALGFVLNVCGLMFNLLLVAAVNVFGHVLLSQDKFRTYQHKLMGGIFFTLALWMLSDVIR